VRQCPVSDAKNKVNSATGRIAKQISVKLKAVLARNPGYSKLRNPIITIDVTSKRLKRLMFPYSRLHP
jgi:hypothetical protein